MAFTRTPSFTPRSASTFVRFISAALTAPPMANSALPVRPPTPMMLTIVPRDACRCGHAARLQRIAPKNLRPKPSAQSASDNVEEVAALGRSGVVHQHIQPAEPLHRRGDDGRGHGGIGQIDGLDQTEVAERGRQRRELIA